MDFGGMIGRWTQWLKKKTGPFPRWVYAAIIIGGLIYWNRKRTEELGEAGIDETGTAARGGVPLDVYESGGGPVGSFPEGAAAMPEYPEVPEPPEWPEMPEAPEWPEIPPFPGWPDIPEPPVPPGKGKSGPKAPCKKVSCPRGYHKVNTGGRCKCVKNKGPSKKGPKTKPKAPKGKGKKKAPPRKKKQQPRKKKKQITYTRGGLPTNARSARRI
jgi:hypothetical protein